jgi:hypothetical protein
VWLALLLLYSDVFRLQASVTEVFPLTLLWAAFLLLVTFVFRRSNNVTYLVAFLVGMGVAVHQTLVLILPALVTFVCLGKRREKFSAWKNIPLVLMMVLLGGSIILFLPIRSLRQPVLDWEDPQTLTRLWGLLTRARYGFFQLAQGTGPNLSLGRLFDVFIYLKNALLNNAGWFGLTLLVLGSVQSLAEYGSRRLLVTSWVWILISGPFFFWYANASIQGEANIFSRFILLPYLMVIFLIGVGCTRLWKSELPLYRGFMIFLLVGFVVENGHFKKKDAFDSLRWDLSMREAAINTLKLLPSESVLFADRADETEFSLGYLLFGEARRPNLRFIDCNAGVTRSIYGDDYYRIWGKPRLDRRETVERDLINKSQSPVFYATVEPTMIDVVRTPYGLLHRAWSIDEIKDLKHLAWDKILSWRFQPREPRGKGIFGTNMNLLGKSFFENGQDEAAVKAFGLAERVGSAQRYEVMGYWSQVRGEYGKASAYYQRAYDAGVCSEVLYSNWGALLVEMGRIPEAISLYEQGISQYKGSVEILYNLAVAHWEGGHMDLVKPLLEKILVINPRNEKALSLLARIK